MIVVTEKLIPVKPTHVRPESATRACVRRTPALFQLSASFVLSCVVAIAPVSEIGIRIDAAGASKQNRARAARGMERTRLRSGGEYREHKPRILRLSEFRDEHAGVENGPRSVRTPARVGSC